MQAIYGTDINVNSNSPDGQLINTFCQNMTDLLELAQSIYNSFGYMSAYGTQLDQRVNLMGLTRNQGTYTQAPVLITVNQALTLYGLDQTAQPVFTIADASGNQYQLVTTYSFGSAASRSMIFQAVAIGEVQVTANTITNQVTNILGVTAVNNPITALSVTGTTTSTLPQITGIGTTSGMVPGLQVSGAGIPAGSTIVSVDSGTQITISHNATASGTVTILVGTAPISTGVNEETDTQLKVRAAQSFALASTGPADSIEAALQATPGITDAMVIENPTASTVSGVPAHSIWAIVTGGTAAQIGQVIYAKKGDGAPMKGAQSYVITRPNGTSFTALWDTSIAQPLYITFGILWRGAVALDNTSIINALVAALTYKLGDQPSVGDVVTAMATIAPTAIVLFGSSQGVSLDGISYFSVVQPSTAQYYYTVAAGNIVIT
jgi:hypothetical protein